MFIETTPNREEINMSQEKFPKQLKTEYYSERDLLEINNEFQNLKKEKKKASEYVASFTKKMNLVSYLVPSELSKIKKFDYGLPTYYVLKVK